MKITRVDSTEGLYNLADIWDNLLIKNSTYSPYMTYGWVCSWWNWLREDQKLFLLLGKTKDTIVGIAPLVLSKRKSGIRRLEFMIDENGSRFDFLVSPDYRDQFFHTIADYLVAHSILWDECLLNYYPCSSPNYKSVKSIFTQRGCNIGENFFYSSYINQHTNWDQFLNLKKKKFRNNLKSKIRKCSRDNVLCKIATLDGDPDELTDKILHIESNTWKYKNGTAITSKKATEEFYRSIIAYAADSGCLFLGIMEKQGQPIAYDFNWAIGESVFSLKMGYDESFGYLSPGKVLFAYTVEQSIESGFKYHELMGLDEGHKREWTKDVRKHSRLHIYHNAIKSRLTYFYNFKIRKCLRSLFKKDVASNTLN